MGWVELGLGENLDAKPNENGLLVVGGSTEPEHNQVVTDLDYRVSYCKENGRKKHKRGKTKNKKVYRYLFQVNIEKQ